MKLRRSHLLSVYPTNTYDKHIHGAKRLLTEFVALCCYNVFPTTFQNCSKTAEPGTWLRPGNALEAW